MICRIILSLFFLLVGCEGKSPTEPKLEERLIGVWRRTWVENDTTYVSLTRFQPEGLFLREVHRGHEFGEVVLWLKGHFIVVVDVLYMTFDESSEPGYIGETLRYEIIVSEDGKIHIVPTGSVSFWEKVQKALPP